MTAPLLSADEAAARIGCCVKTLGRLRQSGKLHFYKTAGRGFRYSAADCDAYLDSCRTKEQVSAPKPRPGKRTARVIPIRRGFAEIYG